MPVFFMKILRSSGTTLPFELVPTVMSSVPMPWRRAIDTMSEYSDEILAASFMIFWSSATARLNAAA